MLANCVGESESIRNMILSRTYLIDALSTLVSTLVQKNVPIRIGMLNNIIWCVHNIVRAIGKDEKSSLTIEEQTKLLFIIKTFINQSELDVNMQDLIKALQHLSNNAEEQILSLIG